MKITKTWFKTEIEFTPNELRQMEYMFIQGRDFIEWFIAWLKITF